MSDNSRIDQAEQVILKSTTAFDRYVRLPLDTANRFQQLADGTMQWGTGSATPDTNLYRPNAAGLKTDGAFTAVGDVTGASYAETVTTESSGGTTSAGGTSVFNTTTAAVYTLPVATAGLLKKGFAAQGSTTLPALLVCGAGATFDGTNQVATFNAAGASLNLVAASSTRWYIISKTTSVTLSTST